MVEPKKKCTIASIAKELGVSPSTVSRAFNPESKISDEVRQTILQYAKKQNYVVNRAASRLSMKEINIGLVFTDEYDYATKEYLRGVTDGYRELFDLKINLETNIVEWRNKTAKSVRSTLEQFRNFDGLIVSGLLEPEELSILDDISKKTNIVLLNADAPQIGRLFASYHDPSVSSCIAAEFIGDCLRRSETRNVVIFTGDRKSDLHRRSNEAFLNASQKFGINVAASYDMKDSPEILKWQLHEMNDKLGFVPDGIYITSGKSLELCKYIKSNGLAEKTVTVGFDLYDEMIDFIKQGTVWATIYQNLYKQAKNAFIYLVKYIINEGDVNNVIFPTPELIMKSNLKFYTK